MQIQNKIKVARIKYQAGRLGLVVIGIVIGVGYLIAYQQGTEMYQFVTESYQYQDKYFEKASASPVSAAVQEEVTTVAPKEVKEGTISVAPSPTSNRDLVAEMGAKEWGESEALALMELVQKESSFNHLAKNPNSTASGLFQLLDGTYKGLGAEKTTDPVKQIETGIRYVKNRYELPSKAVAFHQANGWY